MKALIPLLLLLVAGAVFFLFTQPALGKIKELQANVATYTEALTNSRKLISVRDKLIKKYNNFPSEDVERLKKLLPDSIDNVRLIIDLSSIARKYGMDLKNVRITSQGSRSGKDIVGPDAKKYDSLDLGFTVTGTYDIFRQFLADLERSLRLVDVTEVSFSSSDKDTYDFSLGMRTYWLK